MSERSLSRPLSAVDRVQRLLAQAREDVDVVLERDPAVNSRPEALLYPHLHALWIHRIAHRSYLRGHRFWPRLLSMAARFLTGLDIHPGATIGRRLFIDHGNGVVIGETAVIGDDVTLYHQVTLGAVGWWKDMLRPRSEQRHPTIEDHVIIGAGSQVLGPVTVGAHSKIGAHALLLESVPPGSLIRGATASIVRHGKRLDGGSWLPEVQSSGTPTERADRSTAIELPADELLTKAGSQAPHRRSEG